MLTRSSALPKGPLVLEDFCYPSVEIDIGFRDFSKEPMGESILNPDLNLIPTHGTLVRSNHKEPMSEAIAISGKNTGEVNDLVLNEKSVMETKFRYENDESMSEPSSVMETARPLSGNRRQSELPMGEAIGSGYSGQSHEPLCQRSPETPKVQCTPKGPFGLFMNGENQEKTSVNQDKGEYCLLDSASACNSQSECSFSEPKFTSFHTEGASWDLNIAMETFDSSSKGLVMTQAPHDTLDIGAVHKKNLESFPVELLSRNFKGRDMQPGRCPPHEIYNHRLCDSGVGLDLQLRPPFLPEIQFKWGDTSSSEEPSALREMTNLSLSLAGDLRPVICELCDNEYAVETEKVESNNLKSVDPMHAKSESCQDDFLEEASAVSGILKLSGTEVEVELHKGPSLDHLEAVKRRSLQMKPVTGDLTSNTTEAPKDASAKIMLDLNFIPEDYDSFMLNDGLAIHIDASVHMDAGFTDTSQDRRVSQGLVPVGNNSNHSQEMPTGSSNFQDPSGVVSETSHLDSVSPTSKGNESCSPEESCSGGTVQDVLPEPLISYDNEVTPTYGTPGTVTQSASSNVDYSKSTKDNLHMGSYGVNKLAESDDEVIDMSIDSLEQEPYETEIECGDSLDSVGPKDMVLEQTGSDDEYEDGGIREVDDAVEGPDEETEVERVHTPASGGSVIPVNVPTTMPSGKDDFKNQLKISIGLNSALGIIGNDGECHSVKNSPGIDLPSDLSEGDAAREPTSSFTRNRLTNDIQKTKRNHLFQKSKGKKIMKGYEKKPKFGGRNNQREISEGGQCELGRHQGNGIEPSLPPVENTDAFKMGQTFIDGKLKYENRRGKFSRIDKLNSVLCQKKKGGPAGQMSRHNKRNRLADRPFRGGQYPLRRRYENCNYTFKKSEYERSRCKSLGKHGSDLILIRGGEDSSDVFLHEQDSGLDNMEKLVDNSTGTRYPRLENTNEGAFAVASKYQFGNAAAARRQFASQRQMPGHTEGKAETERRAPDSLSTHEESSTTAFPDAIVDPFMMQRAWVPYKCAARNFSPVHMRGAPPKIADFEVYSSCRSRTRSPRRWLNPVRSPKNHEGYPNHCKPSPTLPRQNQCFAGDAVVQRGAFQLDTSRFSCVDDFMRPRVNSHGKFWMTGEYDRTFSNNSFSELPVCVAYADNRRLKEKRWLAHRLGKRQDDGNVGSLLESPRKHPYFPEAVGYIDPLKNDFSSQESVHTVEEEHDWGTYNKPISELAPGPYVDNQRRNEIYGPVLPSRHHPRDDSNEESLPYDDEHSPRFWHKMNKKPPKRGCRNGFQRFIRNQPWDNHNQPRDMAEQEGNHRYRRRKGWHDADSNRKQSKFTPAEV